MDDLLKRDPVLARPPLMENRAFRAVFFGIVGVLAGALAGALSSVIVASLLRPECTGDSCVSPFVLPLGTLGALIGLWEGIRYAGKPIGSAPRHTSDYDL